jgi:hypothetical protein
VNPEQRRDRSIPLVFLLTTIIAYGLLIPRTGFYWDDWPFAWIARFFGPAEFIPAFDGVRPFLGPIFLVTTSLIPPVPIYWQIFALFIRFVAVLSAWFAFSQVWAQHKQQALVASFLFLLFPAYSQHWVAFTHINQEWISLIFFLLSYGFTGYALRNPKSFFSSTIISLLLLIPAVFPTEYFVGDGPLRFFFIWIIVREQINDPKQRIIRSVKLVLPYLLIWLADVLWLFYFYTLGNYDSYDVEVVREPLSLLQILVTIGETIWKVGIYAWGQILLAVGNSLSAPSSQLTLLLIAVSFVFFVYYLRWYGMRSDETRIFAVTAILVGIAGLILGRVPSFAAELPLRLQSSWDRFTISMMLGGSLFTIGIVDLLVRNTRARTYIFALLIALSIGQQFFNANIFRRDWEKQQEIYSQLAWRIPAMEPGTALITDQLPVDYETDLSFTAPLNWMYAPDYNGADLPYALLYTEKRLATASLSSLSPDTPISLGMRAATFHGSTSQVIVIHMPKNGCLRVLDPALGDEITYARESDYLLDAIPLSKPELIDVDSDQTPRIPFLSEAEHTWCYYFTKAELARQAGDWQQIVDLYEEASSFQYEPGDPFEWLVFIEAQAMTGNFDEAQTLSKIALAADERVRNGLCKVWKRVPGTIDISCEDDA